MHEREYMLHSTVLGSVRFCGLTALCVHTHLWQQTANSASSPAAAAVATAAAAVAMAAAAVTAAAATNLSSSCSHGSKQAAGSWEGSL